jgi:hypothetical protein
MYPFNAGVSDLFLARCVCDLDTVCLLVYPRRVQTDRCILMAPEVDILVEVRVHQFDT